jgi:hypothetical protein
MNDIVRFLQNTVLRPLGYLAVEDYVKPWSRQPYAKLGEDAILAGLLGQVPGLPKTYVDIGAADGVRGSNTALLADRGWRGWAFEMDKASFRQLALQYEKKPDVTLLNARITPENVLDLFRGLEIPAKPGVLSLDIDSYDLFVLQKILSRHQPGVLIAEINEKIPPPAAFAVKYRPDHVWAGDHFFGASLSAFASLLKGRYAIHRLEYNNVFFVRRDLSSKVETQDAVSAYDRGFRDRSDRAEKFPWNADVEPIIQCRDPRELRRKIAAHFSKYRGRFLLR